MAEQAKLPTTEKPVLLSKDIEAKMMALDREVQYLLNKAKFTKPRPRPKDKNGTRAEPPLNASEQGEKVIRPPGKAGCLAPGVTRQEKGLISLLGLHFIPGFLPGRTEDAKPISEPEKETRELGKLGTWISLSLVVGKLAGIACFLDSP